METSATSAMKRATLHATVPLRSLAVVAQVVEIATTVDDRVTLPVNALLNNEVVVDVTEVVVVEGRVNATNAEVTDISRVNVRRTVAEAVIRSATIVANLDTSRVSVQNPDLISLSGATTVNRLGTSHVNAPRRLLPVPSE